VLSSSRYTNKEISLIFLNHIILHTNTGLDKLLKVLLIDQHSSYIDLKFTIKATAHNIHLYPFFKHLTYIFQPLNVSIFQLYKHWHKKAVQHAMCNLNLNYNVASFMCNIQEI
jgi:DDE superfamily endonuclease